MVTVLQTYGREQQASTDIGSPQTAHSTCPYPTRVWGQASIAQQEFLDPLQNGLCKYANGDLVPHTTDDLPAPKAIIEMINCHCKGTCSSQRCGCRSHNLACTELCLCSTECRNDDDYNCNPLSDESTD